MKKWLTRTTIAAFFFAGGMGYSIIVPTCWDYMHEQFGAEKWLYVLAISAMSISNMLIGPIMGALYDRTHRTKLIILFLNLFEIGGNFLYFAASSKYIVLASRFIAGVGWTGGTVIFSDLARTSLKKERSTVYSVVMGFRQLGVIIGPALNIIFRKFSFHLGNFHVDKYTLPGIFMMVVWCLLEVMFIFAYFQLPPNGEYEQQEQQEHTPQNIQGDENEQSPLVQCNDSIYTEPYHNNSIINTETTPLLQDNNTISRSNFVLVKRSFSLKTFSCVTCCGALLATIKKIFRTSGWMISMLIYEETVVLLAMLFVTLFNDWTLQANLVPMAESVLKWTDFETSFFFTAQAGLNILTLLLVLTLNQKTKIPDIYMITFGVCSEAAALIWFLGFYGGGHTTSSNVPLNVFEFSFTFALILVALPFSWVIGASLYSKILPMPIQGFGQGVRRSVESLAGIIGPLWAGTPSGNNPSYYLFLSVPIALLLCILFLLMLSFRRLQVAAAH